MLIFFNPAKTFADSGWAFSYLSCEGSIPLSNATNIQNFDTLPKGVSNYFSIPSTATEPNTTGIFAGEKSSGVFHLGIQMRRIFTNFFSLEGNLRWAYTWASVNTNYDGAQTYIGDGAPTTKRIYFSLVKQNIEVGANGIFQYSLGESMLEAIKNKNLLNVFQIIPGCGLLLRVHSKELFYDIMPDFKDQSIKAGSTLRNPSGSPFFVSCGLGYELVYGTTGISVRGGYKKFIGELFSNQDIYFSDNGLNGARISYNTGLNTIYFSIGLMLYRVD